MDAVENPDAERARRTGMATVRLLAALGALLGGAHASAACPAPPPPVVSLSLVRYYADADGTVVDRALQRANERETAPLKLFLSQITRMADTSVREDPGPRAGTSAACALRWMEAWARAGALLGRMHSKQAEHERKWDFTGLALAYVKLAPHASADQRVVIEVWLAELASASRRLFDDRAIKRNNHWYWLGLGLGGLALATGSDAHWAMARAVMEDAARDIRADGALPAELARGQRALHYHAFAVTPLIVLAELAHARGEDWYALGDGALHRLARLTLDGLANPERFDVLAASPQERPSKPGAGWIDLYQARFPDRMGAESPKAPRAHRWLGGDVRLLMRALGPS